MNHWILFGSLLGMVSADAGPYMMGVFGTDMVLQHDQPLLHGCGAIPNQYIAALITKPISNTTAPEVVRVHADTGGCFLLKLAPRPAMYNSSESVLIQVKIAIGQAGSPFFAVARNVLYGTVILCGGQSNMVHPLSYDYNYTAQANASHLLPHLRLMQVGRQWGNGNATLPLGCTLHHNMPRHFSLCLTQT
jgi:hypothetical protein